MQQRVARTDTEAIPVSKQVDWEIEEAPGLGQKFATEKQQQQRKRWSSAVTAALVAFAMTMPPLLLLLAGRNITPPHVWIKAAKASLGRGTRDGPFRFPGSTHDKLLGGLLAAGFAEQSCHSRYESAMYRRTPARQPSPYLISKLRRHEALQKRCGPNTDSYRRAVEQLRSGKSTGTPACKYVVSISYRGLGNRILAAASAFLYAVLTDRVLLVDRSNGMDELFCEPFPDTTWLLPLDFPLTNYTNFNVDTGDSYGNMLKNKVLSTDVADFSSERVPVFAYAHLDHDCTDHDELFYCDEDQRLLRGVQWLVMRTDNYIVPGLFHLTSFQDELDMLFPERDAVFHHLGRYLFHPSNHVWGLITRYYRSYFSKAQHRVGLQVRVFGGQPLPEQVLHQITTCTQKEKLLPEVLSAQEPAVRTPSAKSTAVLVTSLNSFYCESIKGMYWEHATATGEVVSVHQPSHEEYQHFGTTSHEMKAWAEIYLLSLSDVLVTTGWSTFGYVAQGLGGLKPWVMYRPVNNTVPDPPCSRDVSMEPCFHKPPSYNCKAKRGAGTGKLVPHVRHCKDVSWGLKLVERTEQ